MKYKICQICAIEFTYNKFIRQVVEKLVEEEIDVTAVFTWEFSDKSPSQKGVKFKNIEIRRSINILSLFKSIYRFYFFFRNEKFDLIEVHSPIASIIVRIAAKLAGCNKVVYKVHGFYFHEYMPIFLRFFHISIEFLLSKLTNTILTVSKEDYVITSILGMKNPKKINYLGNGVNVDKFSPSSEENKNYLRKKFNLEKQDLVIGCVGRLVVEKGFLELFDAFKLLADEFPNMKLLICGEKLKSDHAKGINYELKKLENEFQGRIILPGNISNIHEAYKCMDIFCLPSWREGMPFTLIEASMSGLPLIATDIRGCREVIMENYSGLLIDLKNKKSLTKSLKYLLRNKSIRKKYGNKAHQIALRNHNEQTIIKKEILILKKLLTGN